MAPPGNQAANREHKPPPNAERGSPTRPESGIHAGTPSLVVETAVRAINRTTEAAFVDQVLAHEVAPADCTKPVSLERIGRHARCRKRRFAMCARWGTQHSKPLNSEVCSVGATERTNGKSLAAFGGFTDAGSARSAEDLFHPQKAVILSSS